LYISYRFSNHKKSLLRIAASCLLRTKSEIFSICETLIKLKANSPLDASTTTNGHIFEYYFYTVGFHWVSLSLKQKKNHYIRLVWNKIWTTCTYKSTGTITIWIWLKIAINNNNNNNNQKTKLCKKPKHNNNKKNKQIKKTKKTTQNNKKTATTTNCQNIDTYRIWLCMFIVLKTLSLFPV
jgi:hypothetical protein